jgi:hypothetical protein
MTSFRISRRQVLGAAATLASVVLARDTTSFVITDTQLAWVDGLLSDDDLASARQTLAPLQSRILGPDLVWEWRRELGQKFTQGVAAVAITRWDKAMLLSELAREAALPVRQHRIGKSMFRTEIGAGTRF